MVGASSGFPDERGRAGARRVEWLDGFYELIGHLRQRLGGYLRLRDCTGRMAWPERGLYFFFEHGELRAHGTELRVVRVGTHAVIATSRTTLWNRLAQHRGTLVPVGGNHRGSIFRLLVGEALLRSGRFTEPMPNWGVGSTASAEVRQKERKLEVKVSETIGAMPFLWLSIHDVPGPASLRPYIERNAIALLSNYSVSPVDQPSAGWLGRFSGREAVVRSGLWNSNHVTERMDPGFLKELRDVIEQQ